MCQISKWIRHRYTCVPHPEPSSLLPPHSIPLGRPSAPAPCFKKQKPHCVDKGPYSQSYGFSSSQVWMWQLDHKEGWMPKNWRFHTVELEKTLESPLDCKEIKPVYPKRNQPWIFIGRTDAEAEAPMLWPPDAKRWLIRKDRDAGKNWGPEEKGVKEDEVVGWHHWLSGHEFEETQGERWTEKPGMLQSIE